MWGNFGNLLETGKNLASKAQAVALDLDKKLNESVGIDTPSNRPPAVTATAVLEDDDDALNTDGWDDNEEIAFDGLDDADTTKKPAAAPDLPIDGDLENTESIADEQVGVSDGVADTDRVERTDNVPESADREAEAEMAVGHQKPAEEDIAVGSMEDIPKESFVAPVAETEKGITSGELQESTQEVASSVEPLELEQRRAGAIEVASSDEIPTEEKPELPPAEHHPIEQDVGAAGVDETALHQEKLEERVHSPIPLHPTTEPETLYPPGERTDSSAASSATEELLANQQKLILQVQDLQNRLKQREDQLISKTEQLTQIQSMHEADKQELMQKIQSTKDEAKRRIQKAKERVDAMEVQLKEATKRSSSTSEDAAKQKEIIDALRAEGEKLAVKQAEMEKAVRAAKGEARELREKLEDETLAYQKASESIERLQAELAATKEDLASARRGESQADKLEAAVRQAREDSELKSATILSLEQRTKELKAQVKELQDELVKAKEFAEQDSQREVKRLRKEHSDTVADLEAKIRTTEQNAAEREDALRNEVTELRKRWQDAVLRAETLSMDMQSSTAPLLRQLESAERQNRLKAAAWAELETKLRAELEETVISNEKLAKERSEWKTKYTRLERAASDNDAELKALKSLVEEKTYRVKQLEEKLASMETEGAKMKEEWAEVERLANEGVARVRSEMTKTVVESEERHKSQLDSLQAELRQERNKRLELERQVDELVDKAGMLIPPALVQPVLGRDSKPMKLRQSEDQVSILNGALNGLGESDDDDDGEDEEINLQPMERTGSYAALAECMARMKAAERDLNALRQSLAESERSREKLLEELVEARPAKERLPLVESRLEELEREVQERTQEYEALQEDMNEMKTIFQRQLNELCVQLAAGKGESVDDNERPKSANGSDDVILPL